LYVEALRLSDEGKRANPENLVSLELVQEKAWEAIEKFIQARTTVELRMLISDLLEAMQYHIVWMAPPEKSRGHIDVVASIDPLGAKTCRILIQIKNKGQAVTMEGLRSFLSILGPNDFGLLLSTGGFTGDVREEFSKGNYQKINFVDIEKFFDLWIKYEDGLSQDARRRLPLKEIHFLAGSV
jgi:restriction system protein